MPQEENEEVVTRSELDDVYTSIEIAREEIQKRRNDSALKKKVEDVLRGDIPDIFRDAPRLMLARQVVSPNFELLHFLDLAKEIGLKPAFFEYASDKFITKNDDKYYLAKLYFFEGISKNGEPITTSKKITDIDKYDGKSFSEMKTLWGDDFIAFHHELAVSVIGGSEIYDISKDYFRNGKTAENYYFYYLSLFVCHAVLAENYLLSDTYNSLTNKIFYPNFKKVCDVFGVKPLIIRMVSNEKENDLYWRYYPKEVRDTMDTIVKKEN